LPPNVAEGVLDALGAPVGGEALLGARLLRGIALAVAPPRPGRAGLAEAGGAVDRQRQDEEADGAVPEPLLGEADRDQGEDQEGTEDAADYLGRGAGVEAEGREAEQDQHHARGGDHRGVDRAAPLLGPVDVVEVDPEGELVDREAGADAEGEGADLGPRAVAERGEAQRARGHHRHDPEDEVVQVDAALADHASRPPGDSGTAHQAGAHPDEGEGEDEAGEDEEEPLLVVLDQVVPEVGEDRCAGHRAGFECRSTPPPSFSLILSTVISTAATA
jgi:hypothetical protein